MQFESEIKELDDATRIEIGQRIETGKAKCSLEHIFIIAQILDCTTDYLLFGKKEHLTFSPEQVELVKRLYRSIQS